ncbi:hypothetical protein MPK71_gp282 [Erwinia phage pEa_SNUABM_1]|uniref:Uncharacterized protein n=1 Tax=Erwinia phage pEa_SNUABM_1 TaxID=2869543 RepID=A0AAE8C1B0_9CAUD|nr:hypothetical protein MPK71_gp282 [Erwinia phage pEa_SNUABM_1]QZE57491.1 hypothetical protein pEaSNUABM1_00282 [Erwinia phage pEa_SNUABM_1]
MEAKVTQSGIEWHVTVTQNDQPSNTFKAVYHSEEEYQKWMDLHKNDYTVEVDIVQTLTVAVKKGTYPDVQSVVDPNVTYSLEAFITTANDWVIVRSGITTPEAVTELVDRLNITPESKHAFATKFRVVRVVRSEVEELWGEMW